ncbi:MAG TPA: hypothetical protein VF456_00975 [Vicinamibacterales bacterium]
MPISGLFAVLLHAAVAAGAGLPGERPVVRVQVQTEGSLAVDRRTLAEILKGAGDIWRPYADVTFTPADESARVSGSLQLLITDRTSTISDGASLGWIEFVDGRPSNHITVSTGAATALLRASRWNGLPKTVQRTFLVRAMTRAIAHELGHYLLASREHVVHGLMRGELTADDIMQPRKSSYRLDRAQVQQLQQGALLARRDKPTEDRSRP